MNREGTITINVSVVYMAGRKLEISGPIKIIKSKRHIKNRYIGYFMYMSFAAAVFCIVYSVLYVVSFM